MDFQDEDVLAEVERIMDTERAGLCDLDMGTDCQDALEELLCANDHLPAELRAKVYRGVVAVLEALTASVRGLQPA